MKVIGCCAYFHDSCIETIVGELQPAGVELHLWALERPRAGLEPITRGQGLHPKWPLMLRMMSEASADFDYVLFFDDDIVLPPGFVADYFATVGACGADLSQPALTHDSHTSHAITRQEPDTLARITNFVEVGPLVCMTRRFYQLALPFFDPISPLGWGYEAQWSHLAQTHGLKIAIVDRCPVRHTRPVGANYSPRAAYRQMQQYLQKYGNPMPTPIVYEHLR